MSARLYCFRTLGDISLIAADQSQSGHQNAAQRTDPNFTALDVNILSKRTVSSHRLHRHTMCGTFRLPVLHTHQTQNEAVPCVVCCVRDCGSGMYAPDQKLIWLRRTIPECIIGTHRLTQI
jgi:hypothetical protein